MKPMDDKSYDQHQIEAPLVTCVKCSRRYYSTANRTICFDCNPWPYGSPRHNEPQIDVNGHQMYE